VDVAVGDHARDFIFSSQPLPGLPVW
jgi:hypothetical protein